jgi:hypothetical protein
MLLRNLLPSGKHKLGDILNVGKYFAGDVPEGDVHPRERSRRSSSTSLPNSPAISPWGYSEEVFRGCSSDFSLGAGHP